MNYITNCSSAIGGSHNFWIFKTKSLAKLSNTLSLVSFQSCPPSAASMSAFFLAPFLAAGFFVGAFLAELSDELSDESDSDATLPFFWGTEADDVF